MNSFIIFALVLSVAISAFAHRRGPPGRGGPGGPPPPHGGPGGPHGGHGGPRGGHGPPNVFNMFPDCKSMAEAMKKKHKEMEDAGQIGPKTCQEQDHKMCFWKDMKTVRCAMTEEPEDPEEQKQACLDQVEAFMEGVDMCDAATNDVTEDYGDTMP